VRQRRRELVEGALHAGKNPEGRECLAAGVGVVNESLSVVKVARVVGGGDACAVRHGSGTARSNGR